MLCMLPSKYIVPVDDLGKPIYSKSLVAQVQKRQEGLLQCRACEAGRLTLERSVELKASAFRYMLSRATELTDGTVVALEYTLPVVLLCGLVYIKAAVLVLVMLDTDSSTNSTLSQQNVTTGLCLDKHMHQVPNPANNAGWEASLMVVGYREGMSV